MLLCKNTQLLLELPSKKRGLPKAFKCFKMFLFPFKYRCNCNTKVGATATTVAGIIFYTIV